LRYWVKIIGLQQKRLAISAHFSYNYSFRSVELRRALSLAEQVPSKEAAIGNVVMRLYRGRRLEILFRDFASYNASKVRVFS
jgi:hypothetical protein